MCSTLSIKDDESSVLFFVSVCWVWLPSARSTLGGVRRMMGLARDQWRISWAVGETMILAGEGVG